MNKQLKSKWVKALRSGKYRQGFGTLKKRHDINHRTVYCCLGVLRELMPAPYQKLESKNGGTLSKGQLTVADISYKVQNRLVNMNDGFHNSFTEIADYIEQKL